MNWQEIYNELDHINKKCEYIKDLQDISISEMSCELLEESDKWLIKINDIGFPPMHYFNTYYDNSYYTYNITYTTNTPPIVTIDNGNNNIVSLNAGDIVNFTITQEI